MRRRELLVTMGTSLVSGCSANVPIMDTGPKRSQQIGTIDGAWPTYRGQNTHRGRAVGALDGNSLQSGWIARSEGIVLSQPIAKDEHVYAIDSQGGFHVYDASTGKLSWSKQFDALNKYERTPALFDSGRKVAMANGKYVSVVSLEDREQLWEFNFLNEFDGSPTAPTVRNRQIFYGCSDEGGVVAFDTATGEPNWRVDGNAISGIESPPTIRGPNVFVVSVDGTVRAIEAKSGEIRWEDTRPDGVTRSTVAAVDNRVFVAGGNGRMYAYDTEGSFVWSTLLAGGKQLLSPAVGDSLLAVADQTGVLYVLERTTGEVLAQLANSQSRSDDSHPPVINDNRILFVGSGGELHLLEYGNESIHRRSSSDTDGSLRTQPIVIGDKAFVGGTELHSFVVK